MEKEICKEKINWYKLLFTITSTALIACIGWLVSNTDFRLKFVIGLNISTIVILSFSISVMAYKVRYYIKKLGEE